MIHDHNATDTLECHLWPKDPHRCRVILYVQRSFSALSLFGCAVIAGLIIILKKYRSATPSLIFWLSVSGFLRSLVLLLTHVYDRDVTYCRVKGFFHNYFSCTILLWVFMIAVNCLLLVKKKNYKHYHKWYHVIVWNGSLIWATIPFFTDSYGHAGIWCWIGQETGVRFGLWYGPLFTLSFSMFLIYVYLIRFLMKFQTPLNNQTFAEKTAQNRMRKNLKSLLAYPFLYILFSIPIIVYRIYDATNPHLSQDYSLTVVSVVLTPLLGVVYAVAFVLINANLREISVPLVKARLPDLFNRIPLHAVRSNYSVSTVTNSKTQRHAVRSDDSVSTETIKAYSKTPRQAVRSDYSVSTVNANGYSKTPPHAVRSNYSLSTETQKGYRKPPRPTVRFADSVSTVTVKSLKSV